ncbi:MULTISPECIES: hypothetical protein [unclassified Hyphomonas]|jgi:uncharacterized protein|uniref:hypothetical protein n=1 Tax=unclassified Hyphomonas TaxID=2630699 RepID=UPI000C62E170|nr:MULTISPECIES: hypothetical protein [unclassified Hyphomonas]MAL44815.1 hypothetical protein [Hyphomonas sp.]MAX83966.1 hypothetical protein [Hyphomonas sp.]HAO35844.1 hypothetical protein [Hyphomonas sp.]HAW54561.1 hypothetical protein [Hyphomonas sp.]HBN93530.1 hypothetical protein [Hyphomonas sp.]|tara:strand:- start:824 stop:1090 length:267 start_codon:yes stop_codon:yes gene_type:complete
MERDPNLVFSSRNGWVTRNGMTVELCIVRLEHGEEWTLEVVNQNGTSIVWDDPFESDEAAFEEFERTIAEEGMEAFLDDARIIPFPRR